jgi:hypothetical protein
MSCARVLVPWPCHISRRERCTVGFRNKSALSRLSVAEDGRWLPPSTKKLFNRTAYNCKTSFCMGCEIVSGTVSLVGAEYCMLRLACHREGPSMPTNEVGVWRCC